MLKSSARTLPIDGGPASGVDDSEPRDRLRFRFGGKKVGSELELEWLERKESRSRPSPVGMPLIERSRSSQFKPDLAAGAEQSMVWTGFFLLWGGQG